MIPSNRQGQQSTVPPGFRFHPTDEELLYYYLRKKVSYEAIDLDVIREVDLNKLEPWDLKEKCKIGTGPQNEWYFFSHKDKKYPTGTRTNRATMAGFWKATGRDKAIHMSNSKRIGMRKTLVFYTGRAPHGQKTDWIMHEYRLEDESAHEVQEDGWVVCRVFKKKNHRGFQAEIAQDDQEHLTDHMKSSTGCFVGQMEPKHPQSHHFQSLCNYNPDCSMHLPQLFSPDQVTAIAPSFALPTAALTASDVECSQNLLRLTSNNNLIQQERFGTSNGDWSFLDKLLASTHQQCLQLQDPHTIHSLMPKGYSLSAQPVVDAATSSHNKFPSFQYLGCDSDVLKFAK